MQSEHIKQETMVVQIMERIKELITSKEYKVGDKLPSENELAELFGTGLSSIREAIKIYNYLGILESKPAKGPYICNANNVSSEAIAWAVMLGKKESFELMEMRESMELFSVLQVVYKSVEEPELLNKLIDELNAEIKIMKIGIKMHNVEQTIFSDFAFHKHIIDMSDNQAFITLFSFLKNFLREEIKATYFDYIDDWSLLITEHQSYIDALKSKDDKKISDRVSAHFLLIREKFKIATELEQKSRNK